MNRTQPQRVLILITYIVLLFVINYVAFGKLLPEKDFKGLWFYAGMASLLLGNLLVTPFFTKPVDAISYTVVSIISIFLVNNWENWLSTDKIIFCVTNGILGLTLIVSFLSILTKDSSKVSNQKFSKSCLIISEFLGNQRVVFSLVIIFALIVFHRNNVKEMFSITIAWVLIVLVEPDKHIFSIIKRIRSIWEIKLSGTHLGIINAYQTPSLMLISQPENSFTDFGTPILFKNSHNSIKTGLTLNYIGLDEQLLLRAMEFSTPDEIIPDLMDVSKLLSSNSVIKLDLTNTKPEVVAKIPLLNKLDDMIGIVDDQTNIETLQFEILKDQEIEEGRIVEVDINNIPVLYQIIDGLTKEDIVAQKNKYGYAKGEAKKIGVWNERSKKFEPAKWLPQINSPVYLKKPDNYTPDYLTVGHFPKTNFTVNIKNIHELVTHNTAILGILGIGKSMLSIELVERMIAEKIKIICLDLTNQYAELLKDFYNTTKENEHLETLYALGARGKNNVSLNVEEGGSINQIHSEIKKELTLFLDDKCEEYLKIYNPSRFEVWRQDSRPFQGNASMATLTPTEITQMISECALEICQQLGMTTRARVCLVYEEAHSLIPEWNSVANEGDKAATNGTARAILQGRKYGLGCLLITQRTANVTKTILNQCNSIFAMRTFDDTGKAFIANYIGSDYSQRLSSLQERHAVFYGKSSSCENPVLIRLNDREEFLDAFRKQYPIRELKV